MRFAWSLYYDNNEPVITIRTYEYNSDNRIIKQTYSDEDGEITGYGTFSYDKDGNVTSSIDYQ